MQVRTLCRSCSAACGIVVDVEGARGSEQVMGVRGDPQNIRSHGYICPKGASLSEFHHRSDRLEQPLLSGSPVDWDRCLDDLATRLANLRDRFGADSIAVYQGTGAVSDSLALPAIQALVGGLGTSQFYSAATVDVAPALRAAEMVCGFFSPWPVWLPEDPAGRLALLIGWNPALSHGYLTMLPNPAERMRAYRSRGGQIWLLDPRRTRTARLADRHLALRPGSDAILLAWLIRELMASGDGLEDFERYTRPADRARLAEVLVDSSLEQTVLETGLAEVELVELLAAIRAAGRIAVVAGTGVTLSRDALLAEWLRWVLLIVTGSLDREGGMWFNPGYLTRYEQVSPVCAPETGWVGRGPRSRPELPRILDQNPCVALVDEIEAGHVRALIVAGSSPLTAFPEPARLRAALGKLDALVAIDIIATPLTAIATHVLPATGQLERADLVQETHTMVAPAAVAPVAGRRPMWWMLAQLGRRLDLDLLDGIDPDRTSDLSLIRRMAGAGRESVDSLFAAGPDGLRPPRIYGWVRERALPEGRWRLLPPGLLERLALRLKASTATSTANGAASSADAHGFVLVCSRQLTRTNSTPYMSLKKSPDTPSLHLHPHDALSLGVREGGSVIVRSDVGRVAANVKLDSDLRPGVVSMSHGWFEANVSHLTSSSIDVDPLTCQPPMTGIPVRIRAIA